MVTYIGSKNSINDSQYHYSTGRSNVKRAIIYGGSFEPPHKGHAHVIQILKEQIPFDILFIVPNSRSPLKEHIHYTKSEKLQLLTLFINDLIHENADYHTKIKLESYELEQQAPNYTIDTFHYLKKKYPLIDAWHLAIGSDHLFSLDKWKNIDLLLRSIHLVCIQRHVYNHQETAAYINTIAPEALSFIQLQNDISPVTATTIRNENYLDLKSHHHWLTPSVNTYLSDKRESL